MDPGTTATVILEQNQILREIRDEMRFNRGESGIAGGSNTVPGPRPGNAFVRAQLATDAVLAGQWNTLSWSSAYRNDIRSSLVGDVMGATGMGGAPSTLTQWEFQGLSRESLYMRGQNFMGNLIAPGSVSRMNSIADDIFRFSPRFMRAGDSGVGIMGMGFDRSASRGIAMDVEKMAVRDLRMSTADYGAVVSNGLQSGQFDLATGAREFKEQIQQVARITADLTRMTRMTVEEVSRSMGALRQFGISDPAAQARTIMQMDASARVAGVSQGDMAAAVTAAMQSGVPMGIGAEMSAGLASGNVALARTMSRLLPAGVIAAGGGAIGIGQAITNAQQQFLASQGGYYALRGGLASGTDLFSAGIAGLTGTGGTVGGILGAEADRLGFMNQMGPGAGRQAYLASIQSQLRMLGVDNMASPEARNMAFGILRGQMGDAAALTFADANFTSAGIRASTQGRIREMEYMAERDRANEYSRFHENTSLGGSVRRVMAGIGGELLGARNWAMDWFTPTAGSRAQNAMLARNFGAISDRASLGSMVDALHSQNPVATELTLMGPANGREYGQFAGALVGGAIGTLAMPAYGLGTIAGGLVGGLAFGVLGDMISPSRKFTLKGEDVGTYLAVSDAASGRSRDAYQRGRELILSSNTAKGGSLFANTKFNALTRKMGRGALNGEESIALMREIQDIAKETGEDASSIMSAAKSMGMDVEMSRGYGQFDTKAKMSEAYAELLGGTGLKSSSFNFTITENAMAVRDYLHSVQTGDKTAEGRALAKLSELGFEGGAAIDQLRKNFEGFQSSGRAGDLIGALDVFGREGASMAVTNRLDTVARLADSLVTGSGAQAEAARKSIASTAGDRRQLLRMINGTGGDGAALRAALRESNDPLFNQMMGIGGSRNLLGQSNDELVRQFNLLGDLNIDEARKHANGDNERFKSALQLGMLGSGSVAETEEKSRTDALQHETAQILERITNKLVEAKA